MDGARFKMLPAFGLLLLLSWSLTCVHGTAFDIHDLIFYIFGINKEDVRYLDKLVGIHTKNGVFDKDGYDNQLKQNNPLLHAIMEKFRETYREVEKENREAVGFIDDLFHTARKLRDSGTTLHYAMEYVQRKFNSLSKSTQQYLTKKFPQLKFLSESSPGQKFTGTTTRVIETSTSSAGATTSPTITTSSLSKWEMRKLLDNVANKLEKVITSRKKAFKVERFKPIVYKLRNVIKMPLPWKYEETFKPIIEDYAKVAEVIAKEDCNHLRKSWCRELGKDLADLLTELFKIAVTADPANSSLKKLSDNYTRAISSHPDDLLSVIAELTST